MDFHFPSYSNQFLFSLQIKGTLHIMKFTNVQLKKPEIHSSASLTKRSLNIQPKISPLDIAWNKQVLKQVHWRNWCRVSCSLARMVLGSPGFKGLAVARLPHPPQQHLSPGFWAQQQKPRIRPGADSSLGVSISPGYRAPAPVRLRKATFGHLSLLKLEYLLFQLRSLPDWIKFWVLQFAYF